MALTAATLWDTGQTPQMRAVRMGASQGSRPWRIASKPRKSVPLQRALVTLKLPPAWSMVTSTFMCPSIRVTGSMIVTVAMRNLLCLVVSACAGRA